MTKWVDPKTLTRLARLTEYEADTKRATGVEIDDITAEVESWLGGMVGIIALYNFEDLNVIIQVARPDQPTAFYVGKAAIIPETAAGRG